MSGILYIVGTPIGNLEDISSRALRTLKEADIILAEDTRVTNKLLMRYDIQGYLLSYHQHSREERKLEILRALTEGKNVCLVSDAGTPGISDPGNELIDFLLAKDSKITLTSIPGPSAISCALSICGFDVNRFCFLGFFPRKKKTKILKRLKEEKQAFVFFESPQRIVRTLKEIAGAVGEERRVFVGRELTKLHETYFRGRLKDILAVLEKENLQKGEVVVVLEKAGVPSRN